jgi:hypothetical protein
MLDMETQSSANFEWKAQTGAQVEIELLGESGQPERLSFDIVPDRSADFSRGFLGESTPLAKAILGHPAGSVVPYQAEDITHVRILSVKPSRQAPPKDIAARREETIRKAVEDSDRTNAMIFASSFSGKWGDYDPTGFTPEPEDEEENKADLP